MTAPDRPVRYELKSVKALRGTEGRSIAKWQNDGWELVDQNASTLYTTLNFRRVKPGVPWKPFALLGGIVLLMLLIGSIASALDGGDEKGADVANPAPAASSEPSEEPSPEPEVTPAATPTAEPTLAPTSTPTVAADTDAGAPTLADLETYIADNFGSATWFPSITGYKALSDGELEVTTSLDPAAASSEDAQAMCSATTDFFLVQEKEPLVRVTASNGKVLARRTSLNDTCAA